uniref:tRNA pseudouridine synthase n=1 Tax=Rodentolepis nana TaxID=102285 RepID=A0A0R3TS40_RODNA
LKILYTGWDYSGLARQDSSTCTVAENLITALCRCRLIEDPGALEFAVCGRTDKGVSGLSQVVTLTVRSNVHEGVGVISPEDKSNLCPEKPEVDYVLVANKNLPKDIRVLAWCPVPLEFSPRRDCLSRSYKYFFPGADLDIELMQTASTKLVGLHDFRNFCSSQVNNGVVNHERVIYEIKITDESEDKMNPRRFCCLYIRGTAFLYHQIRCIASLLFTIGRKIEPPEILEDLLNVKKFPGKPQYQMAEPEPLLFFEPEFENIEWQTSPTAQEDILKCVQMLWTQTAVKAKITETMLEAVEKMFPECRQNNHLWAISREASALLGPKRKSILKRTTEEPLEEKIKRLEAKRPRKDVEYNKDSDS